MKRKTLCLQVQAPEPPHVLAGKASAEQAKREQQDKEFKELMANQGKLGYLSIAHAFSFVCATW